MSTMQPVPAQDPRHRGRYLTEAFIALVVLAIALTSDSLRQAWWVWTIILAGLTWRAWRFFRDVRRFEESSHAE